MKFGVKGKSLAFILMLSVLFIFTSLSFPVNANVLDIVNQESILRFEGLIAETANMEYAAALEKLIDGINETGDIMAADALLTEQDRRAIMSANELLIVTDFETAKAEATAEGVVGREINILAFELWEYYEKYGCFPDDVQKEIDAMNSGGNINVSESSLPAPLGRDDAGIVAQLGYNYSNVQIAAQLVMLGQIISSASPLVFSVLLNVIVGVAVIAAIAALIYVAYIAFQSQVVTYYSSSASAISTSIAKTNEIHARYNNGQYYFAATRIDILGMGGVQVLSYITDTTAFNLMMSNGPEGIYSLTSSQAQIMAVRVGATIGGGATFHSAHTANGKMLNLHHWHSTESNNSPRNTHAWFTW
jgi:hypothetical protein